MLKIFYLQVLIIVKTKLITLHEYTFLLNLPEWILKMQFSVFKFT